MKKSDQDQFEFKSGSIMGEKMSSGFQLQARKKTESLLISILHRNVKKIYILKHNPSIRELDGERLYSAGIKKYNTYAAIIEEVLCGEPTDLVSEPTVKRILSEWKDDGAIILDEEYGWSLAEDLDDIKKGTFDVSELDISQPIPTKKANKKRLSIKKSANSETKVFSPTKLDEDIKPIGEILIIGASNKTAFVIDSLIRERFGSKIAITEYNNLEDDKGDLIISIFEQNESPSLIIKDFIFDAILVGNVYFKDIPSKETISSYTKNSFFKCSLTM